jgi:hypothetical protein
MCIACQLGASRDNNATSQMQTASYNRNDVNGLHFVLSK